MKDLLKEHTGFIFIAALFFILGILRLNDLSLYTDCTRYLIWGNSIAHGNGFVDETQPEPEYYIVNAPFFSVVLAPSLAFFPLSLTAAKVWTLLWGVFALLLFYLWLRNYISQSAALAATLFLSFNPLTLVLFTEVLSESPFLCAILGVFILMDRKDDKDLPRVQFIVLVLILSLVMLLREVGAALVGAVVIFYILRRNWPMVFSVAGGASLLFALWTYRNLGIVGAPESSQSPNLTFILQHFVTAPDTSLWHEISQRVLINFNSYALGLGGMVLYRFPLNLMSQPSPVFTSIAACMNIIQHYTFLLFIPLMIGGIITDFSRSKTAFLRFLFLVLYLCILLAYPVQDVRFLFVLLPYSLIYIAIAFSAIKNRMQLSLTVNRILFVVIMVIVLFPNLVCVYEIVRTNISYNQDPIHFSDRQTVKTLRSSYFSTPWSAMGHWIDVHLPTGTIIASPDKEIVPFAPKQKFLEINRAVPLPMFEAMLRDNAAEYLFAPTVFDNFIEYQTLINESKRFRFNRMTTMNRLNLFRISSRLENPQLDSIPSPTISDLENSSDLLTSGRLALKSEKYIEALSAFNTLQVRFPHLSDVAYQRLLVRTFQQDSARAVQNLRELYLFPGAASYIAPAQIHIHAMNELIQARTIHDSVIRAEKLLTVSRLYWNLGYPQQAYRTAQQAVQSDPSFFVGLLWAWNYGLQIGDTMGATDYLAALEAIDRENPIVIGFKRISQFHDTLRRTSEKLKRSEIRIAISQEYSSVDLPDEALDEAQRAIGENPANTHTFHNLAEVLSKRKKPLAAEKALRQASLVDSRTSVSNEFQSTKK